MRTEAIAVAVVFTCAAGFGCAPAGEPESTSAQSGAPAAGSRNSYQDWPTGPYQVVENWPKPLPDTRHSHDGWTWGSFGGVYAETPDRIWVAMRGELPLPAGAKPWTPYAALKPSRGNAQPNTDGLTATCEPAAKRGWERRFEHVLFVVDGNGNLVDEWPQHDKLFAQQPCGRGPHTIKMSPYDPDEARLGDRRPAARHLPLHLRRQAGEDVRPARRARARPEHLRSPDRHRVAAGRHVLHQRRLRRQARREVRREGQLPHGLGIGAEGSARTRGRRSSTRRTASRSARTAASSSSIAGTSGCRCSTRTASSSTCGRSARRTGRPARAR